MKIFNNDKTREWKQKTDNLYLRFTSNKIWKTIKPKIIFLKVSLQEHSPLFSKVLLEGF